MTLDEAAAAYRSACLAERSANAKLTACKVATMDAQTCYDEANASLQLAHEAVMEAAGGTYFDADKRTLVYPT